MKLDAGGEHVMKSDDFFLLYLNLLTVLKLETRKLSTEMELGQTLK